LVGSFTKFSPNPDVEEVDQLAQLLPKEGKKALIASDSFYPQYAVIDPELTVSISQYQFPMEKPADGLKR